MFLLALFDELIQRICFIERIHMIEEPCFQTVEIPVSNMLKALGIIFTDQIQKPAEFVRADIHFLCHVVLIHVGKMLIMQMGRHFRYLLLTN